MFRVASWFSVVAVLVMTLATLALLTLPRDPLRQPGVTWSWGFLSGYSVRLLDSGRYVLVDWCDVCVPERTFGTWRETPGGFELQPDSGRPSWRLEHAEYRGCERLAGPPVVRGGEPLYFRREGDRCEQRH